MTSTRSVRLAVVDDSSFIRQAVRRMMAGEQRIEVVGTAGSGEELLAHWGEWNPDVVTLDLAMPGMGGLMTLDRIVARGGARVIILSTHSGLGAPQTIEALSRGAADFLDKQEYSLLDFTVLRQVLVERILAVAEGERTTVAEASPDPPGATGTTEFEVVVIGASTGGPPAIEKVLKDLGETCRVPVLVVQHMPAGFVSAFANRLNSRLPMAVVEAQDEAELAPRTVYLGPAGRHLRILRRDGVLTTELSVHPKGRIHCPSVDELFLSAYRVTGSRALGVLLTGMGRDGAEGLAAMRQGGAVTLAQDEASCVVFGMPRAAMERDAVSEVVSLDSMGRRLRELLG